MAEMNSKERYIYAQIDAHDNQTDNDVFSDSTMDIQTNDYKSNTQQLKPGITQIGNQIARYDSKFLLSPVKICLYFPGSCLYVCCTEKQILAEELFYLLVFCLSTLLTVLNPGNFGFDPRGIIETGSGFNIMFSFLAGLYLSLHIARWWRLRTDGIGNIWSASTGIATLLGPLYKHYKKKKINRIIIIKIKFCLSILKKQLRTFSKE
eukprot:646557_1